jgi:hypothetical protein
MVGLLPEEEQIIIWRGNGFPSEKNLQNIQKVSIEFGQIQKKIGHQEKMVVTAGMHSI